MCLGNGSILFVFWLVEKKMQVGCIVGELNCYGFVVGCLPVNCNIRGIGKSAMRKCR